MSYYPKDKLGKYIDILSGFAFKSKDFSDKGIPVIKIKNINPPCVTLNDLTYIPYSIACQNSKYILKKGDILIAMTGSHINQIASVVGRVGRVLYDDITVLNQRVGKIININKDNINIDYVYYFLSQYSVKVELAQKAGGAANQANISPSDIKNLWFPYPPINIQNRIAKILSRYDALIENYQKQIKLLEESAQRLYKEWFVDLRFPGHENTKIVDGVPEGWKKMCLNEVSQILTGKKDANFGDVAGKYPFFTCAKEPIKATSYSFDCDAVVLAGNGDFNVKLYRGKFEAYQRTYVFSPFDTKKIFILFYSIKNNMQQLFIGASGSTIKFLTKKMLEQIPILSPSSKIATQFYEVCDRNQKKLEILKRQIDILTEARDRLLPKLMSGEIEV